MSTIAQKFAHTLKEIGVQFVFGVPSGNMIDYVEALRAEDGIDFILTSHESAAAFMAAVCGKLSGVPGVCFGTFGPGATNLSTGVGCALLDRSPLIAFTDEMPDHLREKVVQMNIDHQQLFFPLTKWTTRFSTANVQEIILKAAGIAGAEKPGSVHVGVPAGIGQLKVTDQSPEVDYLRLEKKRWSPLVADQVRKIVGLLQKAERPILAVGLSAVRAKVGELIIQLSERYEIPVVLTPMAKGIFPEHHRMYTGVLFHALSNIVANVYSKADLVVGIGYDPVEFNYEDWMPEVPLIHIDAQETDLKPGTIPEVFNVVGSLDSSLGELLQIKMHPKNWDHKFLAENKNQLFEALSSNVETLVPTIVVKELRQVLPTDGILCVDVGAHLHLIGQQWITPAPDKLLMTNGWSGMGFAVPAAIAAKLSNPDLPVVAIMGDGGFAMSVGELPTVRRLNLKIVFVIICDNSLSLIKIKQGKKDFKTTYGTDLNILPEEPANHYFGIPVKRVNSKVSYVQALEEAFLSEGSVVIEAVVDGKEYEDLVLKDNK